MNLLITGSLGALGSRLFDALSAEGHTGVASAVPDATVTEHMIAEVLSDRPVAVIACAAWTDVAGAEASPGGAYLGNVQTARAAAEACSRAGVPLLYISSDYAAPNDTGHPVNVYGYTKLLGEHAATSYPLGIALRMSHLPREKAENYEWINGFTVSSREWTGRAAKRLARFASLFLSGSLPGRLTRLTPANLSAISQRGRVFELGPHRRSVTVADMIRRRWPNHQALEVVLTTREQVEETAGYPVPGDTVFKHTVRLLEDD